ncbi:trypsin-like peptidase domain-containing protein [Nonomuraea sp. bgisy101]|uniref:trypsin-like peptidase domain-containing protein n=1 Tax=Nonomuraea sp. bgisy101 TaxID=3413784 RepID=UPI003D70D0BD
MRLDYGRDFLDRVVEVKGEEPGTADVLFVATGFLLTGRLVLTVKHAVEQDGRYLIRPHLGGKDFAAARVVHHPRLDLALLVLDRSVRDLEPAPLGTLPKRTGRVLFRAVGFPEFAFDKETATPAPETQVEGYIATGSHTDVDTLDLLVPDRDPEKIRGSSPWVGASGMAIIDRTGHLIGVQTHHLTSAGSNNLTAVRLDTMAADPAFRACLLDHDVTAEPLPVPLSTGDDAALTQVTPHEALVRDLRVTRRHLFPEHLPFVSPGPDDEADPSRIFTALAAPDSADVLLTGSAGSGKTRTCMQVAALAGLTGEWQVLHVAAAPDVTNEQLTKAVSRWGSRRVLLIIDGLHNCTGLVLETLRSDLDRTGVRVSCLSTVRKGNSYPRSADEYGDENFHVVPLAEGRHSAAVARRIYANVAPHALERWGEDEMARICGERPIIALLISAEIERRLTAGEAIPAFAGVRTGDLTKWLSTALFTEDALGRHGHTDKDSLIPGAESANPVLLASVAALAASPQPAADVIAVVNELAETGTLGKTTSPGPDIVRNMRRLGWIQESGRHELEAVHDSVVEELLIAALLPPTSAEQAHALFGAYLVGARSIDRLIGHLRRAAGNADDRKARRLEALCTSWLRRHAERLAELLAPLTPDSVGTLLNLVTGSPWLPGAVENWDLLVEPWLRRAEERNPVLARALLAGAVRRSAGPLPPRLTAAAMAALFASREPHDHQILAALLSRADLPAPQVEALCRKALAVLDAGVSPSAAPFLLRHLLRRHDLDPEVTAAVTGHALRWTEAAGETRQASFVLAPLLAVKALPLDSESATVRHALRWLDLHGTLPESRFVIRSLPRTTRLASQHASRLVDHTLAWVSAHGAEADARSVAKKLIKRPSDDDAPWVIDRVLAWLGRHNAGREAQYILTRLVQKKGLTDAQADETVQHALIWLDRYAGDQEALGVLLGMAGQDGLRRRVVKRDRLTSQQATRFIGHALSWLRIHGRQPMASTLLPSLLGYRRASPEQKLDLVAHALAWLDANEVTKDPNAVGVLQGVLNREAYRADQEQRAIAHAFTWMAAQSSDTEAGFIRLLVKRPLSADQAHLVIDQALDLLESRRTDGLYSDLLRALLGRSDLTAGQFARLIDLALSWLSRNGVSHDGKPPHNDTDFLLRRLLGRPEPDGRQARSIVEYALAWLATEAARSIYTGHVLLPLLERCHLTDDQTAAVVSAALTWLSWDARSRNSRAVLRALLVVPMLDDDRTARVLAHALAWRSPEEAPLVPLGGEHLDEEAEQSPPLLADKALAWLERNVGHPDASSVLRQLLRHPELDGAQGAVAVDRILALLDDPAAEAHTDAVLGSLLRRQDLPLEQAAAALGHALRRLGRPFADIDASRVLGPLLKRDDLDPAQWAEVVSRALDWLAIAQVEGDVSFVLHPLLESPVLSADQASAAVSHALRWLGEGGWARAPKAGFVLHPLLDRRDLDTGQARQAVDHAMTWLAKWHRLAREEPNPDAEYVLRPLLRRPGLPVPQAALALNYALAWRDKRTTRLSLADPGAEGAATAPPLTDFALDWSEAHSGAPQAYLVLEPLLMSVRLRKTAAAERISSCALAWLEGHHSMPEAGLVLRGLLTKAKLDYEQRTDALAYASDWLARHGMAVQAAPVWQGLVGRSAQGIDDALAWLVAFGSAEAAGYVLTALLERVDLTEEQSLLTDTYAAIWLGIHPDSRGASPIRKALQRRPGAPLSGRRAGIAQENG